MLLQFFPPSFITVLESASVEMLMASASLASALIQWEMRGQEERELEAILLVPGPLVGQLPHSSATIASIREPLPCSCPLQILVTSG